MIWRTMDSAPKDGTDILLARPMSVWIAYWKDGHDRIGEYGARCWVPRDAPSDWWNYVDEPDYPTHWMPLPEPPEGSQ